MKEWKNYGDINFMAYGGCLIKEDDYPDWYYLNVEKGKYKRCSRCGRIKLAHNKYFSKNKTSKDGWYSICKECRNTKAKTP